MNLYSAIAASGSAGKADETCIEVKSHLAQKLFVRDEDSYGHSPAERTLVAKVWSCGSVCPAPKAEVSCGVGARGIGDWPIRISQRHGSCLRKNDERM